MFNRCCICKSNTSDSLLENNAQQGWWCGRGETKVSHHSGLHLKVLPLLSAGVAIFKRDRWIHRPVTLHGDTAGSRGVCSLLLNSSRRLKNRIYGRLMDSVFLYSLINTYLFSLGWFPSSNLRGGSLDWWLFTETQLGPGESAVFCWTLVEKQEAGFIDVWYMLYFR